MSVFIELELYFIKCKALSGGNGLAGQVLHIAAGDHAAAQADIALVKHR
jgi:hypothetical protein